MLFCPGDRPEMYDKALSRADLVVFDLEDAVAPPAKIAARAGVAAVTAAHPRTSIARINAAGTPWFDDDVATMRQAGVQRVMLPKASSPADLENLADFEVVALCETAAGVLGAQQLAATSNCLALMWGGEDLIADTGGRSSRTRQGRYRPMIEVARSSVLLAAAAHGKSAIDAVHIDITDTAGLRREAGEAVEMGFAAKACIHPSHVEFIRAAFRPDVHQVDWARKILAASEGTRGVFRHEDQMIDAPLLAHARSIMERNDDALRTDT